VKLDARTIATAALPLLDDGGVDGLTMRKVAAALGVQAPALYWHVKNKRELLDAMARVLFVSAVDGLEAPRRGTDWQDWLAELAGRLRKTLLRYRDGGRVLAGTNVSDDSMWRVTELTLRTLEDAGFSVAGPFLSCADALRWCDRHRRPHSQQQQRHDLGRHGFDDFRQQYRRHRHFRHGHRQHAAERSDREQCRCDQLQRQRQPDPQRRDRGQHREHRFLRNRRLRGHL